MKPANEPATMEQRYRTLMILWIATSASIVMFFILTVLVSSDIAKRENQVLSLTLFVVGMSAVVASYLVKKGFLAKAIAKQDVALVQQGLVTAAAVNEVAALLGLMDFFVTGDRYYYLLFIIAGIGTLLNLPRRDHLLAASYKKPVN